ncbi:MAG: hypothetical protein KAU62_15020 [Candidatus Heimdallarchaeota archaeon]|nr:hypothetical protein [Candidatus Heimdallarchaeota archaeon]MCG3257412.1 hypothetical protein [Candidatus Heimdallarchaeota archaeon]MCK4612465.1 hypothetical protein [Candidatus Heimdallarchaeota archaeon]
MKSFEAKIPEKLYKYIEKLVDEENFESIDSFVNHSIYWIAELYGFGEQSEGKSLKDLIADVVFSKDGTEVKTEVKESPKVKVAAKEPDIPNKAIILESYGSSKFMFEDAIFAACQFAALKQGNAPISKEEFIKSLKQMTEAGILTQIQQGDKTMWKRN